MRYVALACSLVLAGLALEPQALAGDGRVAWFTIESEHFVVSYHEPLHEVARRVALVAERAHQELAPSMGHSPAEKTFIVVDDTTDASNGFASVLPRNDIRIYASAPPSKSSLGDHDDWLYALVAHEYAHILHLDNIDGLPKLVNKVVGKTWAPNQVQPRWIIEGLATYEESRHSSGGRLRHGLFGMNLRLATLAGDERDLDEMSNGPRSWPHGNTAYLYGSHFLNYIFERFGEDKVSEMSHNLGSNPIPYGINSSIRRATGMGFDELHDDWRDYRRDKYALEREAIERAGVREGRRLTFTGQININPRYSRDGKQIIWQHGTGDQEGQYAAMPSGGNFGQKYTYAIIRRTGEFDVLSDGSLILEQTDTHRAEYTSQELYRWDRKTKVMHRLSRRVRMRDPAVSPSERRVAFVMTGQAQRRLAIMDLVPEAKPRILWEGDWHFEQAFDPAWSPDGKQVAFSAWREGGYRDILIVDVDSGVVRELGRDRAQDVDPAFDPSGRYLYYSSDRTGVFNVFAYELATGALHQVTNVLGCAVGPAISPDGKHMVYQGYRARGFELYEMSIDQNSWTRAEAYISDRPDSVVIREGDYVVSQPRPYRSLETLAPKRYELQLDAVNRSFTLQVEGSDIAGLHSYNLGGSADLRTGYIDIGGTYSNKRHWAGIRVAANRTIGERGGYVIADRNTSYLEERLGATLSLSLPVLRQPSGSGSITLSYDYDYFRDVENSFSEPNPNDPLPRPPETDMALAGVALRFSYSDTQGSVYTLGPQLGRAIALSMRINEPALGSEFRSLNLDYRLQTYYKLPWGRTPVLALRIAGGMRASGRARVSRYSLGGVPEQNLVSSLLDNARAGSTGFLRGYESRAAVGTQMHMANVEYRQELLDIETGLETLPFYLKKVHVAGLFDAGNATDDSFSPSDLKTSLGVSLRLNILIGYFIPGALDIGYARGLADEGIHEWWTLLTGTI
ncbi:MAG: BamA/TamA family outer membrane protein [Myxococcales bacterium]|nr:BamA/TamA family outer membrane protein [Myxococcales bacterium]